MHSINFGAGFQTFTGWEYLCIDIANHFGMDKELFETRIKWVEDNINHLGLLVKQAETPELFQKAVLALRRVQRGESIGHIVHFDGVCSGVQILSALTGCENGAYNTGMIDPTQRMDAYSNTTGAMNGILDQMGLTSITVARKDVKQAVMTSAYGSKAIPKKVFGEGEMLDVFHEAVMKVAPGAFEVMDDLLDSWRPYALEHTLVFPDGFKSVMPVMETKETRVEVDELDHATFTLQYRVNEGTERGRANVANATHGCDAYVLRGLERRCNYDAAMVGHARDILEWASLNYATGSKIEPVSDDAIAYYLPFYKESGIADIVILPYLTWENVMQLPVKMIRKLLSVVNDMLAYRPFPIITVHDAFGAHANNCNITRYWYKELLADLADSTLLQWILNQLFGIKDGVYHKKSENLGEKIRGSNYALS